MAQVAQSGILAPVPRVGRYLFFGLVDTPQTVGTALLRMAPLVDGLFSMSKPVTGSYFWCPPVRNGQLDLRAVGL